MLERTSGKETSSLDDNSIGLSVEELTGDQGLVLIPDRIPTRRHDGSGAAGLLYDGMRSIDEIEGILSPEQGVAVEW